MLQRNWLDLSRKLVDRYDFDFTLHGMSDILGKYALTFFGEGVKITTQSPNPFLITLNGSNLNAAVSPGVAYDKDGNFTSIQSGSGSFTIGAGHASLSRWDLLVIRYKQTGDTPVPKPSDPISTVFLNLHDDYELILIPGTPGLLSYPAKSAQDVILAGVRVPPNASLSNQCTIDYSVRESGFADVAKYPVFKQEALVGVVDGVNKVFTISSEPIANSILLTANGLVDTLLGEYTISGVNITFVDAPEPAQKLYAWYIVMEESSTNPLSAAQEIPTGDVDGVNDTFTLSGMPANKEATTVFIDGLLVPASEWSLVQSLTSSQIIFNTPPGIAEDVYCFYLTNASSNGSGPVGVSAVQSVGTGEDVYKGMSGSIAQIKRLLAGAGIVITDNGDELEIAAPGSAGGYSVYGSMGSPLVVTAGPITIDNVQRQIRYIKSNGGDVVCTIPDGTIVGQELTLRGTDLTDTVTLNDSGNKLQNGNVTLNNIKNINYIWNGSEWDEQSRR